RPSVHQDPGQGGFEVLGRPTEFVGRAEQLRALDEVLERAVAYQAPQLVTVLGNQGTGKSRLCVEWLARAQARSEKLRVFRGRADQRGGEYGVSQRLLAERFDVAERGEAPARLARFRAEVAEVFGDRRVAEIAHFLGAFVDLAVPENPFL